MMMARLRIILLLAVPGLAAQKVAVIAEGDPGAPARHGLQKLEQALTRKGLCVTSSADEADYVIRAGLSTFAACKVSAIPESLCIWKGLIRGKQTLALGGSDAVGLMYAALDTAERVAWPGAALFQNINNVTEEPRIAERGVSMYTMQRAWFEKHLYDENYWKTYFDMLAADRFNTFVVIFGYENGGFMAPLYPYFFNVDGFPGVEFVGITPEQQKRNRDAFNAMIGIAHERGIRITAGIWDHIYRGGVQGGGIPGASANAGKRVPGLVYGVTTENLSAYTKAALLRFLKVFPEIDGIQFRMHDESGLKHEEMAPFWHDVFVSIKQTHPKLNLDLRAKELPDEVIDDALRLGLNARVSTKYWMEQMGLPFHPTHTNVENQRDRRHGYADLLTYPQRYKVHWQLWNGGTTRLLLWGDPDYVRRFASTVHLYGGDSFDINEMLATWMLGEPHDEAPLEILNPKYKYYEYEFQRYWYFYRLWGRLTYNPETRGASAQDLSAHFGPVDLTAALSEASKVLPRIVASSYLYRNFPTTRGWAEMDRQGSLPEYAKEEGSDIQQFMNVADEAKSIIAKTPTPMRRPEENSKWFADTADRVLAEVASAGKAGDPNKEAQVTLTDLKILAGLARYHSHRLQAGVYYNLYKQTGSLASFDDAIAEERRAIDAWKEIVDAAGDIYSENLAFGAHAAGFSRHWKEEYGLLQNDFTKLLVERKNAVEKPGAQHFELHSVPAEMPRAVLLPDGGNTIFATASAASGIRSVRLRYRHVTQFEDYQTAEMPLDHDSGYYTGYIPESFIDPKWDLMYFIEVIDNNGNGRMFPDLDRETPYRIIPVKH